MKDDPFDMTESPCHLCQGRVERKTVTSTYVRDGEVRVVSNIPAWECRQCGERYFSAMTVEKIEKILKDGHPTKMIEVPLYRFPQPVPAVGTDEDEVDD